ncbi:hypothetical protein [Kordia jejudonensis]|uniref:hypothetical protein n=1 Tax=Kordia jejudonensis TaxID=1348245 RepID=UPI00062926BB|nr:hypothetical protein [Kordia jejudonensis]
MNLTAAQIEFISNSLTFHGLENEAIKEDIVDHICSTIEASHHINFELAYEEAIQKLGGYYNIKELQKETKQLLHSKTIIRIKRGTFLAGFGMIVFFAIGLIFKMFHWPFANIALLLGLSVFLFAYCPLIIYTKYKQSIFNYQS